jgi:hypothetical protein
MKRLRKFIRLQPTDRRLLIKAALLLGAIRLGLWLLPFQTLRSLLARAAREPTGLPHAVQPSSDQIAWAVRVGSHYVPGAKTCLPQALVAQVLLERCGYPARLRVGVVKGGEGQLEAHAWVESQGRIVVGGSGVERYIPLSGLDGDAR